MKPYFCFATLFLIDPAEVTDKTAALRAAADRDLAGKQDAVGILSLSGDGEGDSMKEAIEDAVMGGSVGAPDHWVVVNSTTKDQYVFADVLVW